MLWKKRSLLWANLQTLIDLTEMRIRRTDIIFVKKITGPQYLRQKNYAKKRVIRDICLFATKVRKWFEMRLNQ